MKRIVLLFISLALLLMSGCSSFDFSDGFDFNGIFKDEDTEVTEATEPIDSEPAPTDKVPDDGNSTGYLVSKITVRDSDGNELSVNRFAYDDMGKITISSYTDYTDTTGASDFAIDTEYDDKGRILSEILHNGDTLLGFTTYEYSTVTAENEITGVTTHKVIGYEKLTYDVVKISECDAEGNLLYNGTSREEYRFVDIIEYDVDKNPTYIASQSPNYDLLKDKLYGVHIYTDANAKDNYQYKYDYDGNLFFECYYTDDVSYEIRYTWENGRITAISYMDILDINNNYVDTVTYTEEAGITTEVHSIDYYILDGVKKSIVKKYNEHGITELSETDENGNTSKELTAYNDLGLVTEYHKFGSDGKEIYESGYEYEYDASGNITKSIRFKSDGSIDYSLYFETDGYAYGIPLKTAFYNDDGSISYYNEFTVDESQNITAFRTVDADGNEMQRWEYVYDGLGYTTVIRAYTDGVLSNTTQYEYIEIDGIVTEPYVYARDNLAQ